VKTTGKQAGKANPSWDEPKEETKEDLDKGLTEEQVLANHFFELYKGLDRAHGKFVVSNAALASGEKVKGRATTEISPYTVKLWNLHLNGNQGLGVVPITDEGVCWWGAIDVDVYPLNLEELEGRVHRLGLPLIVIRTKSGGAHLTLFLSEPVSCKIVRNKLYEFAMVLGYGGVEIFPKQTMLASKKDVGNWLNMPYFEHKQSTRFAIFKGKALTAKQFIVLAHKIRITEEQLTSVEVSLSGEFEDGPPCLQMIAKQGAPEGTRNNTLFAMGVYAKHKHEDDWEVKIEEMNVAFIDPPLKSKEVQIIIKSAGRKDYFYPCNKAPLITFCNKDLCRKRQFGIGQGGEEFGLNLGSLVKIATEPPVWIIDIEGVRVQLDTEDLMSQERFRRSCVMAINKLPPRVKNTEWDKILREKLEGVEIIDAPVESRQTGRINQYAFQFLINTPMARVKDEIVIGRPWYDKETDMICFRGNDLLKYLSNYGLNAEPRKIWASLRDGGAEHGQIKVKTAPVQVWKVPKNLVPEISIDLPPDIDAAF
jgi:hypothetical protein